MARSSTVHYIAPSSFGISPNCNGSENDLDVFVASKAKIKVYSPAAGVGYEDNNYQEWTLKGRNRRLAESSKPYTIYARLPKYDKSGGYLVFAPMNSNGGKWTDKYAYLTAVGMEVPAGAVEDEDYWYVRMGDVSLPVRGERTVTFDTGILGTDQYWAEEGEIHGLYISKVDDDEAHGLVGFRKGIWIGEEGVYGFTYYGDITAEQGIMDLLISRNFIGGMDGEGFRLIRDAGNDVSELEVDRATIREKIYANWLQSSDYTGEGMLDSGFRLWYENGRSKLVIDDIVARGKFSVYNLETRIMTHAGGDVCFSGAGSKLFYVEYLARKINPDTGLEEDEEESLGYTTINSPWMLRDKLLLGGLSGYAAWANRRQIQRTLTPEEKARVRKFRCYVFSDDGTMKTRNWWHVHDLARCQTFDWTQMKETSEGYYSGDNVSNTVYWRRVAGIGSKPIEALGDNKIYDYFDLWNVADVSGETWYDPSADEGRGAYVLIGDDIVETDPETGEVTYRYTTPGFDQRGWDDWPVAGDDVVQFGNARDVDRQAVNVLQVTGGEPGLKVYHGIHDYRTDQCKWVDIGYDATLQRANAQIFGDCYIGERYTNDPSDGGSYVWFTTKDTANGQPRLRIKARISAQSTYGDSDKSLYDYVREDIWSPDEIETMIGTDVAEVQKQLDGQFAIHYQSYTPYPQSPADTPNEPAASWIRDGEEAEHLYDLFYDRRTDKGWRWSKYWLDNFVAYRWTPVGDSSILASLKAAADAQDTADGKRRVFVNQPVPPYDAGDLWSQGASGDIMRCIQGRTTGSYVASDWEKASKYTDDTAFNSYISQVLGPSAQGDATTVANAARALNNALKAQTDMDGGLMLTSMIVMRNLNAGGSYTTWGGLSGTYTDGTDIAAWFGGDPVDHEASPSVAHYATSLFRMNGSGYVAGGNIKWDRNGVVTVKSTNFSTEHFCIDGVEIFQLENVGTVENPHYRIKAFYDFYSVGGISALGAGDGGEQPSYNIFLSQLRDVDTEGVEEGQVLMREGTKWVPRSVGSTTSIATLSDVDVENVQNGDALVFNSTQRKWVPGTGGVNMSTIWAALAEAGEQPINHSHIAAALDGYAHTSDIPTDNNQLNNGAGYITSSGSCSYASSAGSAGYATSAGSATSATTAGSAGTAGAGTSPFYINAESGNPRLIMHAPNRFWGNMCVKSNQEFYFYKNNDESTPTCVNADWFYAYSKVTALSDARKKDIVGDIDLTVEQVANAPAVKFYWKDKRDNDLHVGSIAQYWQPILPETVYEKNDELSMDYSVIGLSAAKVVAKRVVDQGQEIKELKEELKEKGQEIKDLKSELRDIKEMLNQILKGHGSR